VYFLLKKYFTNFVNIFIAFSSLFFYAYWNIGFTILLLISVVINYCSAKLIQSKPNYVKLIVYSTLFINIGSLIFFKYTNFIIENINIVFGYKTMSRLDILLPLGISFYTFTQSSYIWDVYKGERAEYILLII